MEEADFTWKCDEDTDGDMRVGSGSVEKSRSFRPLMLRRAGLMRGRRPAEPELDVTDPAIEGVGEGPGDDGRLTVITEK